MVVHGFGDLKKRNAIKQHIVAKQNNEMLFTRFITAHGQNGFEALHCYTVPDGEEWSIVI